MEINLFYLYAFITGACVGSFLNVVIYRTPQKRSIIFPSSMCPACGASIKWYDNIPLISFILLGGRCRACSKGISFRYPAVEILCGLFATALLARFGISIQTLVYYIFICLLIVVSFIDIEHRIIPDSISLPGIATGFAASFFTPSLDPVSSVIGILAGGGTLYIIAVVYYLLKKQEGMGGGDIKLLAMIGAFIGLEGVILTIFVASAVGTIAGLAAMPAGKKGLKLAIPFGPFLSLGALTYIFFGKKIIIWYMLGTL